MTLPLRLRPTLFVPVLRLPHVSPKVGFAGLDGSVTRLQCLSDLALYLCAQRTVQMKTFHYVSVETLLLLSTDVRLYDQVLGKEFLSFFLFLHHCYQKDLRCDELSS